MIECGGCGRQIETSGMLDGAKFLCARCYHVHIKGPEPGRRLGHAAFTTAAYVCLAVLALCGIALCIFYVTGAGNLTWSIILSALMLLMVGCPAILLSRKRNLAWLREWSGNSAR